MTKAQLDNENAAMRIAIEAASGCYSFEKAKGILLEQWDEDTRQDTPATTIGLLVRERKLGKKAARNSHMEI